MELPAGYRFLPTEEELISYYLSNKINELPLPHPCPVFEVHSVYDTEPWNLFPNITPNQNIHVFSNLINTSNSSKRIKRVAGCGTWKLEASTDVYVPKSGSKKSLIGFKKLLTFEVKKNKEENNKKMKNVGSWIMHEYSLVGVTNYAVCEIKYKVSTKQEFEEEDQEDNQEDDLEAMLDNLDRKRKSSPCFNSGASLPQSPNPIELLRSGDESDHEPAGKRTRSSSCSSSSPQPQVVDVPEFDINELDFMELHKILHDDNGASVDC